ncbi:MAG: hypothetical protein HDS31_04175 [Bacteroides sp.]|nr:hypothetical protein [Bacteroides sp.]
MVKDDNYLGGPASIRAIRRAMLSPGPGADASARTGSEAGEPSVSSEPSGSSGGASGASAPSGSSAPSGAAGSSEGVGAQAGTPAASVPEAPSSEVPAQQAPVASVEPLFKEPSEAELAEVRSKAASGYDMVEAGLRERMAKYAPEDEKTRLKRERQERSKRLIANISDGLGALSNLFFTNRYSPNIYRHEEASQGKAVDARIEQARALREKNDEAYFNAREKLGENAKGRAKALQDLEEQLERRRAARQKGNNENEAHGWLRNRQPLLDEKARGEADEAKNKALEAGHKANKAKVDADNEQRVIDAGIAKDNAQTGYYNSAASNQRSQAQEHGVVHHFNGKTYPKGSNDYMKDVFEAGRDYNERHRTGTDEHGNPVYQEGFVPIVLEYKDPTGYGNKRVARNPAEYAGELETRLREEKKKKKASPTEGKKKASPTA